MVRRLLLTSAAALLALAPAAASAQSWGVMNRAEFVALVMQDVGGAGGSYCFRDVHNQWYAAAVCGARNRGFVNGYPDNSFRPANIISFAEAAAVAVRARGIGVRSDTVWYRPYMEILADYDAFPRSVTNITSGITRDQAVEMIAELRNGKDRNDNDDDDDDVDSGDLRISITDSDNTVDAGDTVTYTIRIQNRGNDDESVDITAMLDDDMTFVSASDDGDHNGDEVEWEGFDVDEDETETLTLRVRIRSSADDGDTVRLRVEVDGETATETTKVNDDDDDDGDDDGEVSVSVSADEDEVEEGDTITYTIRLENNDSDDAVVDVRAKLDSEVTFVSASDAGDEFSNRQVRWDNLRVDEDETLTLKLKVRVKNSVDDGDIITLSVEAGDDEDDLDIDVTGDDDDDDDDDDNDDDISVSITDTDDPVDIGDTVTYRIRLNNGDNDRAEVDFTAFLDDGMSYISSTDGGDLNGDDEVEWDDVTVGANGTKTVLLTVRINSRADDGDVLRLKVETDDDTVTETTRVDED